MIPCCDGTCRRVPRMRHPCAGAMSAAIPLRLCFLLATRGNTFGGLETIADQLAAGLARRGHQVSFVVGAIPRRAGRTDYPPGVAPLAVPILPWTSPLLRGASRLVRSSAINLQSLSFF